MLPQPEYIPGPLVIIIHCHGIMGSDSLAGCIGGPYPELGARGTTRILGEMILRVPQLHLFYYSVFNSYTRGVPVGCYSRQQPEPDPGDIVECPNSSLIRSGSIDHNSESAESQDLVAKPQSAKTRD